MIREDLKNITISLTYLLAQVLICKPLFEFILKQLLKKVAFFYAVLLQFIPLLQIIYLRKIHSK